MGELKLLLRARNELYAIYANFRRENDTNELIGRNKDVTRVVIVTSGVQQ